MSLSESNTFLLVDGYNIIGSWPELKQERDRSGLEMARYRLLEALVNYSAFEGYKTEVVFDAHYQKTAAYREAHSPHVSAYYTEFAQTADTYIERTCAKAARELAVRSLRLIVATSDRAQQLTAIGYGAEWMSSQHLASAVTLAASSTRRKSQSRPKTQKGRFLFDCLDDKAKARLSQWRFSGDSPSGTGCP
ncbi:NYN domain-containing protein [Oscillatoria sp. FACHB-1406]|uniref:NYN domain-containing protein n=1 Tax=Oscillatoria sp. FACHB-1406 TaxID=2692846 RepID=UPI00168A244E|nr:NYN domain-containing protein [Oscillatoria sp. FACHB-1406]MBD2579728.1 NYN domain-containing protein [Oscillatoria sp. FACHB-1406]